MPQKVFTAKNGSRYVKDARGRCKFVSGPKKGHRKKGKKKVGGSASVGGSARVGGGLGVTRAYRAVGRASKSIRSAVSKALY